MKNYSQPTTMKNPDHILIHISTDGLPSKKQPDAIANDTVELGIEMWNFNIVSIKHYRKKASAVNHRLKDLCKENKFHYTKHSNTTKARQLDGSNVHLNIKTQSSY